MSKKPAIHVEETEQELISRAQVAVSQCNWVVGECAHKWTQRYARGRTDADFSALLGLSADQVYQRRRVWESFADVRAQYAALKWSHFYAALTWDDAPECLQWADENQATVAEMKAWRRALHGEDLTTDAAENEWGGPAVVAYVPDGSVAVQDPGRQGDANEGRRGRGSSGGDERGAETLAGVARDSGADYAPFREGASRPAPEASETAVAPKPRLSPEQLITRVAGTLERINDALTPEMVKAFKTLPDKKRARFLKAVSALSAKAARLM